MIAALILAAGKSERMGYPKALLRIGTENFVQRLLRVAAEADVEHRAVVLGHEASELSRLLDLGSVDIFVNDRYEEGQLSSLQCGMRNLPLEACEALVVLPVDHPLISAELLKQMVSRYRLGYPSAVIPTWHGKRGHPALFSRRLFQELLDCPAELGARAVLRKYGEEIAYLGCEDEAVVLNVDTPDDYRRMLQLLHETNQSKGGAMHATHQHESLTTAARYCPRCAGILEMRPVDTEGKPQRVCASCGFIFYLNPKVVACTVPILDGKLLLIRRNIDPARGRWTFPGGYVDLGESTSQAAQRETREEVGLEVSLEKLLGVYSYPDFPQVIIVYLARPKHDRILPGIEVQEARYFAPDEIPWKELAFRSTADALRDWLSRLGSQDPEPPHPGVGLSG